MGRARVLQVLADTDDVDDARFALDLHGRLAERGLEVRTMALGPGRRGGLESLVPVMSPSRRSIAAHTQLRREQRWADVVVLRGEGPALVAALANRSGGPPTVLALSDEARRWATRPVPSRIHRLVERGLAAVLSTDRTSAEQVAGALGLDGADVLDVPYGVDCRPPATSPAARRVARDMLGLAADGPVARFVGSPGPDDGAAVARRAAAAAGVVLVAADAGDPDVVAAAADIAVLPTRRTAGPARGLLEAGRDGAALVAPGAGALAELVDDATGRPCADDEDAVAAALVDLADDAEGRAAAGTAASERVRALFSLEVVADRWADLLAVAAARPAH